VKRPVFQFSAGMPSVAGKKFVKYLVHSLNSSTAVARQPS
jgi:hypothetical protein